MAGTLTVGQLIPDVGTNLYLNAQQYGGNVVIGNATTQLFTFGTGSTLTANVFTANTVTANVITASSVSVPSITANVVATTITANTITISGFMLYSNTVTSNTFIPTGYNATFAGPMIVANNIVVTANNGARLVVL